MPRIEWIGVRLPSTNPIVQYNMITRTYSKRQRAAIKSIDLACVTFVRQDATQVGWEIGPTKDTMGLSRHYRFMPDTGFTQNMVPADWNILKRTPERAQYRNLDDPRDVNRQPDYPPQEYLAKLEVNRFGVAAPIGAVPAGIALRLLRQAERSTMKLEVVGQTIHRRASR